MKLIKTFNDLREIELEFVDEFIMFLAQEFWEIFDALRGNERFTDFIAPEEHAFYVFQKGDDVLKVIDKPLDLEYVERFHVEQVSIYRIGIRVFDEVRVYYSMDGVHDPAVDNWLKQHEEGGFHSDV